MAQNTKGLINFIASRGNKQESYNEWEQAYTQINTDATNQMKDDQRISIFEIKKDAERGIAGLAMKLHKKFIGE